MSQALKLPEDPSVASGWAAELTHKMARKDASGYEGHLKQYADLGVHVLIGHGPDGVAIARKLANKKQQVWGAIRPWGKLLPIEEAPEEEFAAHYAKMAKAIEKSGAEVILLESMVDLNEAELAVHAIRDAVSLPLGVSMIFGSGSDQASTVMQVTCEDAATRLKQSGVDCVGCNNGLTIDQMVLIARLLRDGSGLPILAFPEAGHKELDGDEIVYRETPDDFASKVSSLVASGARMIGGGNGVGLEHIRAVLQALGNDI